MRHRARSGCHALPMPAKSPEAIECHLAGKLLPQAEIAAKSFTQYQLGDSGNVGNFENGLGHAT